VLINQVAGCNSSIDQRKIWKIVATRTCVDMYNYVIYLQQKMARNSFSRMVAKRGIRQEAAMADRLASAVAISWSGPLAPLAPMDGELRRQSYALAARRRGGYLD
jgi:uncharacterized membrane protein